jgi:hypothetical protein
LLFRNFITIYFNSRKNRKKYAEKIVKLYCDYLSFFSVEMCHDVAMESKNAPLFLASRSPRRSVGAGCDRAPCLRLAIRERACLCVGGCDDGCCRRHSHMGAFSSSPHELMPGRDITARWPDLAAVCEA